MKLFREYINFNSTLGIEGTVVTKESFDELYETLLKSIVLKTVVVDTTMQPQGTVVRSIFALKGLESYYYISHIYMTHTDAEEDNITSMLLYSCDTRVELMEYYDEALRGANENT